MNEEYFPENLAKKNFFNFKKDLVRCVIEGSSSNKWETICLDTQIFGIPKGTNKIKIIDYNLDLILFTNDERILISPKKENLKMIEVDYPRFRRIQRPRTIIAEDGRIYYDLNLISQNFFEKLFMKIEKYYPQNSFLEIYQKIVEKGFRD